MPVQSAPTTEAIPLSTLRRWALRAAVLGFFAGVVAAIAALQVP